MEAFSLLKYWRGGGVGVGGAGGASADGVSTNTRCHTGKTTILTAVAHNEVDSDEEDGDDGPFFDLEFEVPDEADDSEDGLEKQSHKSEGDEDVDEESDGGEGEREFNFTVSSDSSNDNNDPNIVVSPADDLFFKGRLVPIETSSLVTNSLDTNSKSQFPVSILKSATKFRVFMLGLKKPKQNNVSEKTETNCSVSTMPKQQQGTETESVKKQPGKLFTVKFKVEEVPIMSLFTRDNSSRGTTPSTKPQKLSTEETPSSALEEKRSSKEVMQKYLRKVKPLYFRVSKRYGDKLNFSGQLRLISGGKAGQHNPIETQKAFPSKLTAEVTPPLEAVASENVANSNNKTQKQGNLPAGLRVVCKHLGKSRSASSAVAAAPSAAAMSRRRDDSLLEQQDGIQGAILHCKRSFNSSREGYKSPLLPQLQEQSSEMSRKSSDGWKDSNF